MQISKKWGVAAATALTVALVGGGAISANAAQAPGDIANPQGPSSAQPGSKGGFYLWDGNEGVPVDETKTFTRDEIIIATASKTDVDAEINRPVDGVYPIAPRNTGTVQDPNGFQSVIRFLAEKNDADVMGGINTWNAFAPDSAAGPNGGTLQPSMTLDSINGGPGGIADDIAAGGSYWYGIAYTNATGVQVFGAVYREITIEAGTGNYTVSPMEFVDAAPAVPNWANFAETAGVTAQVRNGNLEISAGAANGGKTVDVYADPADNTGAATHSGVVLDASGTAIVTSTIAAGTRIAFVEGTNVVAFATTQGYVVTQPTSPADDATKVTIADPAEGTSIVTISAGAANANQTFRAVGWSTPTELGNVTTDAAGVATVDAAALGLGLHTVALVDSTDAIVAWGTANFTQSGIDITSTDLSVDVTVSNQFKLEGVAANVNLGSVKRNATTSPVALGAFKVIDDRETTPGWTLNADVADFVNAVQNGHTITKSALGIAPKQVAGTEVPLVGVKAGTTAGAATYAMEIAAGENGSSTTETGTQFDADLTFKAPHDAKKGTYNSTLTLTLATK